MIERHPTRRARCQGDGGAVIIEAALAFPLLAFLAVSMLEFGFAFNESIIVDRGLNAGARSLSNGGDSRLADYDALRILDSAFGSLKRTEIRKVIIYESNALADGVVPPSCDAIAVGNGTAPKGISNLCNVYSQVQVEEGSPYGFTPITGSTCSGSAWDTNYCPPTDRDRDLPDHIGMFVEVEYTAITGILADDSITMKRRAVFAIEPTTVGGF